MQNCYLAYYTNDLWLVITRYTTWLHVVTLYEYTKFHNNLSSTFLARSRASYELTPNVRVRIIIYCCIIAKCVLALTSISNEQKSNLSHRARATDVI